METVYDWLSVAVFAGLVVLLLQRSVAEEPVDKLWHYLPAALGCALSNWLGNNDNAPLAILTMIATLGYIVVVLKPFGDVLRR